jgi:hypothetical protein
VPVGLTFALTMIISLIFGLRSVFFWGTILYIRVASVFVSLPTEPIFLGM